jgi:hypothetical protein
LGEGDHEVVEGALPPPRAIASNPTAIDCGLLMTSEADSRIVRIPIERR